jgi:hypothetical protein
MDESEIIALVPGAQELVQLFGYWPSFHDAEVVSVELNRMDLSRIKVHSFETSDVVHTLGHYITNKHTIVSFLLEDISGLHLDGFNDQNVISGLGLDRSDHGYTLILEDCYGINGSIECARIFIEMEQGIPPNSVYFTTLQENS